MKPLPKPLPCPVCGKEPKVRNLPSKWSIWSWVVCCESERRHGPAFHEIESAASTKRSAINRWNRMVKR